MGTVLASVIPVPVTGIQCAASAARKALFLEGPLAAQTRGGWMPVTSTGMTESGETIACGPYPVETTRSAWGRPLTAAAHQTICALASSSPLLHFHTMKGYVYILASKRNGTLYTGVTSDLPGRLFEHQNELNPGFTSRYGVKMLVWFEEYDLVTAAITREKTIKKWPRQWKLNLIEAMNPDWEDIAHYLHGL